MGQTDKIVQFWKEKNIITEAHLGEILSDFSTAFAYHTCKMEHPGVQIQTVREVFDQDKVTGYTGDLLTLLMIRNARSAYELFLSSFADNRPLDDALILAFQEHLTQGTYDNHKLKVGEKPGTYKQHDYVTGKYDVGAAPEDVQDEVRELLSELIDVEDKNVLKAAAYFHAKFENIHAFASGNGRCGRMSMNYFLVTRNHPPLIFHAEDRKDYFTALEAWDKDQSLDPLYAYLQAQTVKTWGKAAS